MFPLYVNDLSECLTCLKMLFPDNLKIYSCISTLSDCQQLLNENLLTRWCHNNRLNLCAPYILDKSIINFLYEINSKRLTSYNNTTRNLTIIFDQASSCNNHLKKPTRSASKLLGLIKRNYRAFENLETIKLLFNSFVRSK